MKSYPTISKSKSIRESLEVIDFYAKSICYILESKKLVGIATDGDIRRALIAGASLDDPIGDIMNKNFISFHVGTDSKIIRERFSNRIRHIPIVDENGHFVDVADPLGNFRISVLEPFMHGNELKYVTECIETNWISSQGKFVNQFEKIFEDYHNETHALAVSNGTVALHLALVSLGVGPGDEVIIPDLTFAASANAVIHTGATPVFCEIDPVSWCIDPTEIKQLIGPRTKAIMPVHLYGQPCEMNTIQSLCNEEGLLLIEDCAEALGSEWKGQKVGTFGDASTFSFFGNKTISTGEGGMVLFKDSKIANEARIMRDHGMSPQKRYWHDVIGFNYRLTNLQSAIGVAQMEKFTDILEKKLSIYHVYKSSLNGVLGIEKMPEDIPDSLHSNWLFGLILNDCLDRDDIMRELLNYGVETRPFFYSLHEMPPFESFKCSSELKWSKSISSKGLSLPTSTTLNTEDLNSIIGSLIQILTKKFAKA